MMAPVRCAREARAARSHRTAGSGRDRSLLVRRRWRPRSRACPDCGAAESRRHHRDAALRRRCRAARERRRRTSLARKPAARGDPRRRARALELRLRSRTAGDRHGWDDPAPGLAVLGLEHAAGGGSGSARLHHRRSGARGTSPLRHRRHHPASSPRRSIASSSASASPAAACAKATASASSTVRARRWRWPTASPSGAAGSGSRSTGTATAGARWSPTHRRSTSPPARRRSSSPTCPAPPPPDRPSRSRSRCSTPAGSAGVDFEGTLELSTSNQGVELPGEVTFAASDRGVRRLDLRVGDTDVVRIHVEGQDGLATNTNPLVVSPEPQRILWADLHGHSNLSDGTGTPEDYFHYARDVAALDVCALTDHDHWGMVPLSKSPEMWDEIRGQVDAVRRAGPLRRPARLRVDQLGVAAIATSCTSTTTSRANTVLSSTRSALRDAGAAVGRRCAAAAR